MLTTIDGPLLHIGSDDYLKLLVLWFSGSADFFGLNHFSSSLVAPDSKEGQQLKRGHFRDVGVKLTSDKKWPK